MATDRVTGFLQDLSADDTLPQVIRDRAEELLAHEDAHTGELPDIQAYHDVVTLKDVTLNNIDDVVEKLREHGTPELDLDAQCVEVEWIVGEKDGIETIWDFVTIIQDLDAYLQGYNAERLGENPERVA